MWIPLPGCRNAVTEGDRPNSETDDATALLREASDFLAELYLQRQLQAGPLATQAQTLYTRIGRFLHGGARPTWLDGGLEALAMAREDGLAPGPGAERGTSCTEVTRALPTALPALTTAGTEARARGFGAMMPSRAPGRSGPRSTAQVPGATLYCAIQHQTADRAPPRRAGEWRLGPAGS